jgi:hypothetical protein
MPNELIFSKSKEVSTDSPLGTVSVRRYRQIRVLAMCSPLSPSSAVIQLAFNQGLGGIPGFLDSYLLAPGDSVQQLYEVPGVLLNVVASSEAGADGGTTTAEVWVWGYRLPGE